MTSDGAFRVSNVPHCFDRWQNNPCIIKLKSIYEVIYGFKMRTIILHLITLYSMISYMH